VDESEDETEGVIEGSGLACVARANEPVLPAEVLPSNVSLKI